MFKITGILLSIMLFILPTVRCSIDRGFNMNEKNEDKNSSYSEKSDKTQDDDEESDNKKSDNNADKNENKDKDKESDNKDSSNVDSDDKDSSDKKSENDTIIKDRINHWLPTIKKTEPKDAEGLAYIFDEGITLPIDFSKVEGEGQYYDEIRESVTSDYMITQ